MCHSDKSNRSKDSATFWVRIIGLVVATLTVFVLAISGWAYALSIEVGRNGATIETLQEGHREMRREIHDIWKVMIEQKGGKE